eukprot:TRINITY_DN25457_c0_g1_i2.p1 TRINITY_DN25457_c0_g1~~TRINITY_DN25457_c0_g1_i2.p1  ORF type:complete len:553 (+),score=83.98 TRINITY_DN25457_c0_g1_i2:120-1778(+)
MTTRQLFSLFATVFCIDVILAAPWRDGRATFYGNEYWLWDIHQGSCGYGYLCPEEGTGWDIAALPDIHPEYSGSCGRCYEIKCRPSTFTDNYGNFLERTQLYNTCREPDASLVVTITDTCPCYYAENLYSNQRWCCGDMDHLDISVWAFEKLADLKWGVIGLSYREVPCDHQPSKPAKPVASPYPPAPQPDDVVCPRGNFPLRQNVMNRNTVRDSLLNIQPGVVTAFAVSSEFVYSDDQPEVVLDHVNTGGVTVDNAQSFFDHLGSQYDVFDEDTADDQKEKADNADDAMVQLSIIAQAQAEDRSATQTEDEEEQEEEDKSEDRQFAKVALAAARSIFVNDVDESASIYTKPYEVDTQTNDNDQFPEISSTPGSNTVDQESIEISIPEPISSSSSEVVLFQDGFDSDWQVLSFSAEVWEAPGSGVNGGTALCSKIYNGGRLQFYGPDGLFVGQRAVEFWLATEHGVPNININVGKDGKSCHSQDIQSLSQSGQIGAFSRYEITQDMFENNNNQFSTFSNHDSCDFQQTRSLFISNNAQHDTWMCIDEVKLLK